MSPNPYPQPDGYTSVWSAVYSPSHRTLRIFCTREAIALTHPDLPDLHTIHDADRIEFWVDGALALSSPDQDEPVTATDWHLQVDVLLHPESQVCRVVLDQPALADVAWIRGREHYRELLGAERLEIWCRDTLLTELPLRQTG